MLRWRMDRAVVFVSACGAAVALIQEVSQTLQPLLIQFILCF